MEEIKCILCNKESDDIVIEENNVSGRKCQNCKLIYISPRPSLSELIDLYSHDGAHISAHSHISVELEKILRARHHLEIIRKYKKSGDLLEVGAGAGFFLREARKAGFSVFGIELNNELCNYIDKKLGIACESDILNENSYGTNCFDVIYHCDVISHIHDPVDHLRKINKKLNPNGILVLETGNIGNVEKKYFKYFSNFQYPDHLFFFGEESLTSLLEKAGFTILKIYKYSILTQLRLIKIFNLFYNFIKSGKKRSKEREEIRFEAVSSDAAPELKKGVSRLKTQLRNLYHYSQYVARYKIGFIAPKKGRPQTLIVIAQKRN